MIHRQASRVVFDHKLLKEKGEPETALLFFKTIAYTGPTAIENPQLSQDSD
jgi:hypothetical protein